jgi:hypothetical protein
MARTYLQTTDLPAIESLRTSMAQNLNLQTIHEDLKADFRIEFESWINQWTANAFRKGAIASTPNT